MPQSQFPRTIESGSVVLTLTPDEAYVEFKADASPEAIESFIKDHQLELVEEEPGLGAKSLNEAFPDRRWVRLPGEVHIEEFMDRLLQDSRVRVVSPVYHRADLLPKKTGLTFSDFLLVRFKPGLSQREIAPLMKELGTEDVSGSDLLGDDLRRLRIREPKRRHAIDLAEPLARSPLVRRAEPDWAQLHSAIATTIPNDTLWTKQWNLTRIGAPEGWSLSHGANTVVIAILDTGCDLNHEDLAAKYVAVTDRRDSVAGTNNPDDDYGHGTCTAGIAAAESNDKQGIAGVAWDCRIMPIRMMQNAYIGYESRIVDAINWARIHGADVISMSFKWDGPHANADTAIANAYAANIVLVAASGNDAPTQPANTIRYPASHPQVLAVGASDQADHRCVWSQSQASQFGPDLDVVAPGIATWSTDRSGLALGYNVLGTTQGDAAGNYYNDFGGTSGATPHVAGLVGLLRSLYPALTNDRIRSTIEKTAEKVGGYSYTSDPAHASGAWNNEMGYGRINIHRALDFAEVYIKDNPADNGTVPFAGDFWDNSDIVVRQTDDDIFSYQPVKKAQTNYVYVRVTNLGPAAARNVKVSVRAVPYPGTEFVYPNDWTAVDSTHVQPSGIVSSLGTLASGNSAIAKFSLSVAQVNHLYGWEKGGWHPCLLAEVQCENDYGTPVGMHTWLNNNLAQRNLTKILSPSGSSLTLPFVVGNKLNAEPYLEVIIEARNVPSGVRLLVNPWDTKPYFPALEATPTAGRRVISFPDRTRLAVPACGYDGILTLEAGSSFEWSAPMAEEVSLKGASWLEPGGKGLIAVGGERAVIAIHKRPGEIRQMSLVVRVPQEAREGDRYQITAKQVNSRQQVVGGVTFAVEVKG